MKKLVVLLLALFVLAAGYSVGSQFDPETLAMSVGILLGALAGIPVALIVVAAGRRDPEPDFDAYEGYPAYDMPRQGRGRRSLPQPQAPVIILAGNGQPMQAQQGPPQLPKGTGGWYGGGLDAYDTWEDQDVPGQGWQDFPG